MNSKLALSLALGGSLLLLGGCEHALGAKPNAAAFGEPTRQTLMAQVINPDPQYDEPMEGSGDLTAQAIERHRTDRVKQPERIRTTQGARGGN